MVKRTLRFPGAATLLGKARPGRSAASRSRLRARRPLLEQVEERLAMDGALVISELMAANTAGLQDKDDKFSDWIEIHNTTAAPVNLADWSLTDDPLDLDQWNFPSQILPAGGYLVVFATGNDLRTAGSELHTNFKLNDSGEFLALVSPDETTISSQYTPEFPGQFPNVSYGIAANGTTRGFFLSPTPGAANVIDPVADPTRQIVIDELMFHPTSNNDLDEWLEIVNRGTNAVNLQNWQLTSGVDFTFPNVSIPAGGYLVVAANAARFTSQHPGITNVVGGWTGTLGNSGEKVELRGSLGVVIDSFEYSDEGDWAVRARGPLDNGHQGWIWTSAADGFNKSLELTNPALSNNWGANWKPSTLDGGTPGAVNSTNSANIAPIILDVAHFPIIPHATDDVTVTARIVDEAATGIVASIKWRKDGDPTFSTAPMFDDGAHGDGLAGDGVYAGKILKQADRVVVEFYVEAADAGTRTRTWPGPALPTNTQVANLLYQVNDSIDLSAPWTPGRQPLFFEIMTAAERTELATIGSTSPDAQSDARMNATLIEIDGTSQNVRYNVGIRNRGHGSRFGPPNNYHIDIPHDRPLDGQTSLNLNVRTPYAQTVGSAVLRLAGLVAGDATAVQVRVNGSDPAPAGGRNFGSYALVEEPSNGFVDKHYPLDNQGNLYSVVRFDDNSRQGDLAYEGPNPVSYQDTYFKQTNEDQNDWSDLIHLTDVINNAPAATYVEDVSEVLDLRQWMRYLALNALMGNAESGLYTGVGDDYVLYRGVNDPRFQLVPHDLDTIFNHGDTPIAANQSIFAYTNVAGLGKLLANPEILQLYFQSYIDLINTVFNPQVLNPLIDQIMGPNVSAATRASFKQFVVDRTAGVLSQIPQSITINSVLSQSNGYYKTTTNSASLSGLSSVLATESVLVNGQTANWNPRTGAWSAAGIALQPGINRVVVESIDFSGEVSDETFIDIWFDVVGGDSDSQVIARGATWHFLDDGTDQGTAWRARVFPAGDAWATGPAQLGRGDQDEATPVNLNVTTYFRNSFNIVDVTKVTAMSLELLSDDGAVVYLNGAEIYRVNLPDPPVVIDYQTTALANVSSPLENTYNPVPLAAALLSNLRTGNNVIAVEIHNFAGSGDIGFDLSATVTVTNPPTGGGTTVSTDLPAGVTTWTAAAGPYNVTANVSVPVGSTLVIEPGTSVFFTPGVHMTIAGQLLAEGTKHKQIRFTRTPGSSAVWGGLQFASTMADNRITYAVLEWGGEQIDAATHPGMVGLTDSNLVIDHSYFDHAELRRIRSQNSSLIVRNSVFTDIFAPGVPPATDNKSEHIWGAAPTAANGVFLIENNYFGIVRGHNDAIDVDAGTRGTNTVPQYLNNFFAGGGDDAMDFEGDSHIEGNVITNFVKDQWNGALGNSNGLSAGAGHDYYIVRNTYINVQQVSTVKQDSFIHFINNTVIDSLPNTFNFIPPDSPIPGRGGIFEGNVFVNSPRPIGSLPPTGNITFNYNIVSADQVNLGVGNIAEDPRVVADPAKGDFRLLPGSPALGSGLNGLDRGSFVPAGASISGEPPIETSRNNATLTVGGPSILSYKFRVNTGAWSPTTPVATPITLTNLPNGTYTVEVAGLNDAGIWQPDNEATVSKTWTVSTVLSRLLINEVLANNTGVLDHQGTNPDAIELFNGGSGAVDLGGMSLTDNPLKSTKFVFPAGTVINPGQTLVVYADDPNATTGLHLGFSLDSGGDSVYLYDKPAAGGAEIDSIVFGVQLPDFSIGRVGQDQHWALTTPTLGATNTAARTGNQATLKINEWFTDGLVRLNDDFVELYNPDFLPVDVGGMYLTDDPVTQPDKNQIPALSFVGGAGFVSFHADNDTDVGADHVNFSLSSSQELLGLFDANFNKIDELIYYPQTTDWSQGRLPDGGIPFAFFGIPTPGAPNAAADPPEIADLVDGLRITEIMYNAPGGSAYEYLELQNIGTVPLELEGVRITGGVDFVFPAGPLLAAGQRIVIVADPTAFAARYGAGRTIAGQYTGALDDSGEELVLKLPADIESAILRFSYNDTWYPTTDGQGFSLVIVDALIAPALWGEKESWRPSGIPTGSPGTADPGPSPYWLVIDDVSKAEGSAAGTLSFTVTLSSVSASQVTVAYVTFGGTATAGTDYTTTSGVLTFAANETVKTITVPILGDAGAEPDETIFLNLSAPSGAAVLDLQGIGTLTNDDTIGWQNPRSPFDVTDNGFIDAQDALAVIDELNINGSSVLPPITAGDVPPYLDVTGNGDCAPADALAVIDYLNTVGPGPVPGTAPVAGPAFAAIADTGVALALAIDNRSTSPSQSLAMPAAANSGDGALSAGALPAMVLPGRIQAAGEWREVFAAGGAMLPDEFDELLELLAGAQRAG